MSTSAILARTTAEPLLVVGSEVGGGGGGGGVTSLVAGGDGIGVSAPTGAVTVSNTGVTTITAAGDGLGVSNPSGSVSLSNTGVTSLAATGVGISVSAATGALTVGNTGVTSIVAGDGVTVSGATGAVTVTAPGGYLYAGLTIIPAGQQQSPVITNAAIGANITVNAVIVATQSFGPPNVGGIHFPVAYSVLPVGEQQVGSFRIELQNDVTTLTQTAFSWVLYSY